MKKKGQKQKVERELVQKDTKATADTVEVDDEEVNSGFGSYLRSSTGIENTFERFNISLIFYANIFDYRARDPSAVCRCQLACDVSYNCLATDEECL